MNEVLFSEMKSPPVQLKVVLIYFIQDFFFLVIKWWELL